MTEVLALEFAKRRMLELRIDHYTFRIRHFVIPPAGKTEVEAWNEFFILLKHNCDVSVTSAFGVYDLSAEHINEMQYEHHGAIQMENLSENVAAHIEFLHVIPQS